MFRNYIKTALRNLKKNKGFTLINVFGLALGLTSCLLIAFYVFDELSYDRYNENADRIYRIDEDIKFGNNLSTDALASAPLASVLKGEFPEIESVARIRSSENLYIKKGAEYIQENKVVFADPDVFKIFTLKLVEGDGNTALVNPHSLVITESAARRYFNRSTQIVGQTLLINGKTNFKITGIIKDISEQSHFNFSFIISMCSLDESRETTWLKNNFNTYLLLKKGASAKGLEAKFPQLVQKYIGPELQGFVHQNMEEFQNGGNYFKLTLMPLLKIHLESNRIGELGINGSIQYTYIFSAIGLVILLIACVNFVNLSTARSCNRAREVGVRKVLGSSRAHLMGQFLAESLFVTLAATVIAVFSAGFLLPVFNQLSGKQLEVTPQLIIWLVPALLLMVVSISLLAGFYPAFVLSGLRPVTVLKGLVAAGFKGGNLRRFLVIFQFSISIVLIIGTTVIYNQLKYISNKDLGFDRNHVLIIKNVEVFGNRSQILKQEVKNIPGVIDATLTGFLPTNNERNDVNFFEDPSQNQSKSILSQFWTVDEEYLNTMGMKLIKGRNLSNNILTDSTALIINETAAKLLDFKEPIGKSLYSLVDTKNGKRLDKYNIIGVVKDFNFSSLRANISPVMLTIGKDFGGLSVRLKTDNVTRLLSAVQNRWRSFSPGQQIDYSFMDQDFDKIYRSEQRIGKLFISLSALAIIIACLGLFGLAAYAAEQRYREIGIRKVLGANVSTIVTMLSIDFIKLVLISVLIASPIAWYVMKKWLQGFAYRAEIQWWVFAFAGLLAVFIALLTISLQSIKAALTNPVKSLKSE